MSSVDFTRTFIEAAEAWGLDEVTVDDALWACPRRSAEEEVGYERCEEAVMEWVRPGRWDRW